MKPYIGIAPRRAMEPVLIDAKPVPYHHRVWYGNWVKRMVKREMETK